MKRGTGITASRSAEADEESASATGLLYGNPDARFGPNSNVTVNTSLAVDNSLWSSGPQMWCKHAGSAIDAIRINSVSREVRDGRAVLVKRRRFASVPLARTANLFFPRRPAPRLRLGGGRGVAAMGGQFVQPASRGPVPRIPGRHADGLRGHPAGGEPGGAFRERDLRVLDAGRSRLGIAPGPPTPLGIL